MKALLKSQILRFTEKAIHLPRRTVSQYSSKFSKHRYTLPHISFYWASKLGGPNHRGLLDELIKVPRIRHVLGLAELPTPSALCKAFDRLDMVIWHIGFVEILRK